MRNASKDQAGFTLIELLIVVAIIGILAAIAIPNLLTAMQRSKQKRSLADIRAIATAWEARATDLNEYTAAGIATIPITLPDLDVSAMSPASFETLSGSLTPTYIRTIPENDGWSNPYEFYVVSDQYAIRSAGKSGEFDADAYASHSTNDFDCDIVYSNGAFIQWPEGIQSVGTSPSTPTV